MINGIRLKNSIISGANNLTNHKMLIDKLNIFPVPDGDTGTNMSMTINSAIAELESLDENMWVGDIAKKTASLLLRGARGNSGVILSLLFRGFSNGLQDLEEASGLDLITALGIGVDAAYAAVMKPTEGTILTVARMAFEKGREAASLDNDASYVWSKTYEGALEALETTPDLLPVLKKAGVIDAGGKGFCLILEGMLSVFKNEKIIPINLNQSETAVIKQDSLFEIPTEIDESVNFSYCTELIARKSPELGGSVEELRSFAGTIGDSVVVVDDEEIVKVHVHTEAPGLVIQEALKIGELLAVKIENMREQNRLITKERKEERESAQIKPLDPAEPTEDVGFVAVCNGEGIKTLFADLGCQNVVTGGQSMNPSTNDIKEAILATPAKVVFVFPNNKNIILAAEQTISLITDRRVIVVPTKTIPQGVSAMLSFIPDVSVEDNLDFMIAAASKVKTGQVTFASRKAEYGGFKIQEGDILALKDGKLTFKSKDPIKAAKKLINNMADRHSNFINIIYGDQITKSHADEIYQHAQSKYSHAEVSLINGGQPIYYFTISVE